MAKPILFRSTGRYSWLFASGRIRIYFPSRQYADSCFCRSCHCIPAGRNRIYAPAMQNAAYGSCGICIFIIFSLSASFNSRFTPNAVKAGRAVFAGVALHACQGTKRPDASS